MTGSGERFERELRDLYDELGYHARLTQVSGDQGVDLDMMKDGQRVIVQCKATKAPVGPAVARELYGTLMHTGADKAVLATLNGATSTVKDFFQGKPIQLLDVNDIVAMQQEKGPG